MSRKIRYEYQNCFNTFNCDKVILKYVFILKAQKYLKLILKKVLDPLMDLKILKYVVDTNVWNGI